LIGIGIATSRKVARVEGRGRPSLKSISNSLHLRLMKEQECPLPNPVSVEIG